MANSVTIEIDGQTFPLPEEIAADDQLLKAALSPFVPWMPNAQIDRTTKDGTTTIHVVKRADWKGNMSDVLNALVGSSQEKNPAIALWAELQKHDHLDDPGVVLGLEPAISKAISAGENEVASVRQSLQRLVEGAAVPSGRVPIGF